MTVRTIIRLQDFESLRTFWEEHQNHPNNDFEHFQLVCRLRQDLVTPYIAIAENDGTTALLVARLEKGRFSPAIGYFKPLKVPVNTLTVVYQGLLGDANEENCRQLISHLQSFLKSGQADMATLHLVHENSPLLKAFKDNCLRQSDGEPAKWIAHWTMMLPENPGGLLKNMRSKHRSWIVGRQKKLGLAYPDKVVWRWMSRFDDIPDITSRIEVVAARTYQRGLGAGFVDDDEVRQRYRLLADRGRLRIMLLEIEGNVKAFWIGTVYKGVFHSAATGYDPDFRVYELGTLMFVNMIDELVKEGVTKLDFGLGDAFYKERFGDESWQETILLLFAPGVKGIFIRSSQYCFNAVDNSLRRLLQKTGILNRVKTTLRRLARKG